jgi:hypothetical protein
LRVDYMRLKKLVQPTSPERKSAELPRFIELMAPTVAGIAECVVMAIMACPTTPSGSIPPTPPPP